MKYDIKKILKKRKFKEKNDFFENISKVVKYNYILQI